MGIYFITQCVTCSKVLIIGDTIIINITSITIIVIIIDTITVYYGIDFSWAQLSSARDYRYNSNSRTPPLWHLHLNLMSVLWNITLSVLLEHESKYIVPETIRVCWTKECLSQKKSPKTFPKSVIKNKASL